MSMRPLVLCKLEKGKLIDAQENFVDTFNWMVDYINNLRGDNARIRISNPTTDAPVIESMQMGKFAPNVGGGGGEVVVNGIDKDGMQTSGSALSSITFTTGGDSRESFVITDDGEGNVTVKLDTYWR